MTPPERLTSRQRNLFVALAVVVALTRLLAVSHSIWDWDEALFSMALHDYDVTQHHPHPPGFPTFIFLAKIVRLFVHQDFHALRAVSTIFAMLLFPALYALARQLRFSFRTSIVAALLFAFFPNAWYYGGTAFSDIAAVVVFVAAAAATLRGRDDRRWYFIGSALIGLAVTFRPQTAVMALYPWLLASWPRFRARRSDPILAAVLSLAIAGIGYGGAAAATGSWKDYKDAVDAHGRYVIAVDGWRNPHRAPAITLVPLLLIDPYHGNALCKAIAALAALSLLAGAVRRDRRPFEAVLIFGPFFVMALFMLNPQAAGRLSLGYLPMHAMLAADGMGVIASLLSFRREKIAIALQSLMALTFTGAAIAWVWPCLTEVRRHDSPPVEVMHWLRHNVSKEHGYIYIHGSLAPFADYYLPGWQYEHTGDRAIETLDPHGGRAFFACDAWSNDVTAINFRRKRRRLWSLFLERYFDTSVRGVVGGGRFIGWHQEENSADATWRWMPEQAHLVLPPLGRRGELHLMLYAPLDAEPAPLVTVSANGAVIEQFRPAAADFEKSFAIDSPPDKLIDVTLAVDHAIQPKGDSRRLGLRLNGFAWKPAEPKP
jgi:hypothetical protein